MNGKNNEMKPRIIDAKKPRPVPEMTRRELKTFKGQKSKILQGGKIKWIPS